ncbi:hypothetical protein F2Q70_00037225 [Brassica cretica]|uniref:Uncharacterized protein n=1 Tax=Brassica cretica TaxID=69181 RepID=A0A8S9JZN3_BRACR|nr:hypothetical protein F2Q70_00037225 [Brassica cretica]
MKHDRVVLAVLGYCVEKQLLVGKQASTSSLRILDQDAMKLLVASSFLAYAERSVSFFCIDSTVLCISCSPIGVDSASINAIMCSLVDLGKLPSIDFASVLSIDADI